MLFKGRVNKEFSLMRLTIKGKNDVDSEIWCQSQGKDECYYTTKDENFGNTWWSPE